MLRQMECPVSGGVIYGRYGCIRRFSRPVGLVGLVGLNWPFVSILFYFFPMYITHVHSASDRKWNSFEISKYLRSQPLKKVLSAFSWDTPGWWDTTVELKQNGEGTRGNRGSSWSRENRGNRGGWGTCGGGVPRTILDGNDRFRAIMSNLERVGLGGKFR